MSLRSSDLLHIFGVTRDAADLNANLVDHGPNLRRSGLLISVLEKHYVSNRSPALECIEISEVEGGMRMQYAEGLASCEKKHVKLQ